MIPRVFAIILILSSGLVRAQQFHPSYTINLPDTIVSARPARVDLNNDGLLDVLLITGTTSGRTYLQIVQGDTTIVPFLAWQATRAAGPPKCFVVTDYDHDNRLDVVMSTTTGRVAVYLNRGDFSFSENLLSVPAFSTLLIADLDDDAKPEWILGDAEASEKKLMVFRQTSSFMWTLVHDSLKIAASSLALTDQNYDGRRDVFISGAVGADSLVSSVLVNDGQSGLSPGSKFQFAGTTSSADVNADGIFDFVIMGYDHNDVPGTHLFHSAAGTHVDATVPVAFTSGLPFLADMNSDGVVDYNYSGRLGPDTLNIVQYTSNQFDTIPTAGYRGHVFGDEDQDGDLDLVVVRSNTRTQLLSYENMAAVNGTPSMPKNAIAVPVFNRMFYYWDPSSDDHTPQASITYDLYIDGKSAYAGEFDLLNEKRLSVTHGNNGTQNFKLMSKNAGSQFAVQAVDNAFHASRPCVGAHGNCASVDVIRVVLCEGEKKTVQAPHEVLWFSFASGFLGKNTMMELSTTASDTVFYYDPIAKGCDALNIMQVVVSNNAVRSVVERYACEDQSLHLEVEPGWSSVTWQSYKRGSLGTGSSIDFVVSEADTVTAIMTNAGCTKRDKIAVKIGAPSLVVAPDQVRIASGSEVQLSVAGASRYEWRPAAGLSAANIANPVASPAVTTTYVVTGYDSLGCFSTGQVTVYIESGGFVPNLFTPNDDGKNDEIRIYGLSEAYQFVFTIHNREGSEVYRTNDLSEAVQRGWDGTRRGTRQPAGVYFWKVKGELASGERLLLNGKDSGSIVLVR